MGGEAADAFTQDWTKDNNWLVPPLKEIPRVLMYLKEQNARGTILVPQWTQWWWPLVKNGNRLGDIRPKRSRDVSERGQWFNRAITQQVLGMGVSESEVREGL